MKYISQKKQMMITLADIISLLSSGVAKHELIVTVEKVNEICDRYRLNNLDYLAYELETEILVYLNRMLATMDKGANYEIVN